MTTNRTSRRAEDFDRALTEARTTGAHGARIDPTTAALVAVAGALAVVPQRAAPAFRDGLRAKLMAEAASLAAAASVPAASVPAASAPPAAVPHTAPLRSLPKVLAHPAMQVATGGLAAAIAVTGLGVGASRSLPGDALYGLKRTVEGLQVGLAGGDTSEATALLEHAHTRIDEVRALVGHASAARITKALDALDAELRSATSRLLDQAKAGSRDAYLQLQSELDDLRGQLVDLMGQVPPESRDALATALGNLNVAATRLLLVPLPPVVTPGGPTPTRTRNVTPSTSPTTPTTSPPTHIGPPPTSVPVSTPPTSIPVPTSIVPTTPTLPVPTTTPTLPITLPPLP
jgi:hypothetical protein